MNIIFLHSSSDLYGASKILLITVTALKKEGHDCVVILPEKGILVDQFKKIGVKTIIFDLGVIRRKYFNIPGVLNRSYHFIKAIIKIRKIIISEETDLIYTNTTAVFSGFWASKICKKKHIWHIHEIIESPKIVANLISWHINNLKGINIVVSNPVKDFWCINQKVDNSKIRVIHNGIEPMQIRSADKDCLRNELKLSDDHTIIGMIGRIHYWKGQEFFLDIAAEIKKISEKCKFIIVGDAFPGYEYLYDSLKNKQNKLGLSEEVFFLGYRKDVPNIIKGLDIFVLPSIKPDPFPTVILEAMSGSIPVVGTGHGGVPEMIEDGKTGFLIPWNDAVQAAQIISTLIENKEMRIEMGKKGRERMMLNFSIDRYEKDIQSLILE